MKLHTVQWKRIKPVGQRHTVPTAAPFGQDFPNQEKNQLRQKKNWPRLKPVGSFLTYTNNGTANVCSPWFLFLLWCSNLVGRWGNVVVYLLTKQLKVPIVLVGSHKQPWYIVLISTSTSSLLHICPQDILLLSTSVHLLLQIHKVGFLFLHYLLS